MKILVVLPRFPYPLEKGDKLRAYHQIVALAQRHTVYLFCVSHVTVPPAAVEALRPFCADIRIVKLNRLVCALNAARNYFTAKSLQMGYWNTNHAKRACRTFARQLQPDVVYSQMVRTMPLVARLPFPKVMDFQDALSMNTERRMEQSRGLMHHLYHFEFKMLRSSEYNAFSFFDALTIISETDRDAIPHRNGSSIHIIRNGVDFDYFSPSTSHSPLSTLHSTLLFTGNMQYRPNVDAARFLVSEVMPLVWQRQSDVRLVLAGATPKPSVRRLASDRVTVTGSVPDLRPYYSDATLFVAPMRLGSGLQNKLLEAMAMGLPCITTPIANQALGAADGSEILLGSDAQSLADALLALLADPARRAAQAQAASAFVHEHFSWQATGLQLEQVLLSAIQTAHERQSVEDE